MQCTGGCGVNRTLNKWIKSVIHLTVSEPPDLR